jgi:hypothetical protein
MIRKGRHRSTPFSLNREEVGATNAASQIGPVQSKAGATEWLYELLRNFGARLLSSVEFDAGVGNFQPSHLIMSDGWLAGRSSQLAGIGRPVRLRPFGGSGGQPSHLIMSEGWCALHDSNMRPPGS